MTSKTDLFSRESDGHGGVRAVPRRQVYTVDGQPIFRTVDGKMLAVKAAPHPMIYRRRTSDTVLTTPTDAELVEWTRHAATMSGFNGGTTWQGDFQPVGEALARVTDAIRRVKDKQRQKDALSQAVCALADFGNFLGNSEMDGGPAGALVSGSQDELTREDVHAANNIKPDPTTGEGARAEREMNRQTGDQMMATAAKFYASNGRPTRDAPPPREPVQELIQSVQRQADEFWAKQTEWQRTPEKVWGKG